MSVITIFKVMTIEISNPAILALVKALELANNVNQSIAIYRNDKSAENLMVYEAALKKLLCNIKYEVKENFYVNELLRNIETDKNEKKQKQIFSTELEKNKKEISEICQRMAKLTSKEASK